MESQLIPCGTAEAIRFFVCAAQPRAHATPPLVIACLPGRQKPTGVPSGPIAFQVKRIRLAAAGGLNCFGPVHDSVESG
jgi:hypothetical protein